MDDSSELVTDGPRAQLLVRGSLGLSDAALLLGHARLALAGKQDVAVELSQAAHLHAGCVQVLLALERSLVQCGRRFGVERPSAYTTELLKLAGLARWLEEATQ